MGEMLVFVMLVYCFLLKIIAHRKGWFPLYLDIFVVKTRKEAKRLTIIDSIATSKSRTEELRNTLQDCKARRDEYATIISQQSLGNVCQSYFLSDPVFLYANRKLHMDWREIKLDMHWSIFICYLLARSLPQFFCKLQLSKFHTITDYFSLFPMLSIVLSSSERKETQESECRNEIQEAISWYKRVLDFHIEGGYGMIIQVCFWRISTVFGKLEINLLTTSLGISGVKFSFKKINIDNPDEEYSFTIRHANDTYMCKCYHTCT